eukprot:TRINITY_DN10406_c0_g1_i2.p1 TRINITY_DN10406_c0_g1~~TRINITY_DN10406_c0_g1_i2.p1  ORF type:complete len:561 (+),score=144.14 TRINITY_DN10406_c0_g1_i2:60-1685(+)
MCIRDRYMGEHAVTVYIEGCFLFLTAIFKKKVRLPKESRASNLAAYLNHNNLSVKSSLIYCLVKAAEVDVNGILPLINELVAETCAVLLITSTNQNETKQSSSFEYLTTLPIDSSLVDTSKLVERTKSVLSREGQLKNIDLSLILTLKSVNLMITALNDYLEPYLSLLIPLILQTEADELTDTIIEHLANSIEVRHIMAHVPNVLRFLKNSDTNSKVRTARLLELCWSNLDSDAFTENADLMFRVILRGLSFSSDEFYQRNEQYDEQTLRSLEIAWIKSFEVFAMKSNENQLKQYFLKLTKWSEKGYAEYQRAGQFEYYRRIIYFELVCHLIERLSSYFVPFYVFFFEFAANYADEFARKFSASDKPKRKHMELDYIQHLHLRLNRLVLESLRLCFVNDKDEFIDSVKFERLSNSLVNVIDAVELPEGKYRDYMIENLQPCLIDLFELINNDFKWKTVNYNILMKSRADNPEQRYVTWRIILGLLDHLKDRYVSLIHDLLPFLAEGLEDDNLEVEKTCKNIVIRLEQTSGENITEYLKQGV